MDNWHLSWYPPLISLSVLSCRLSGLVQGALNRKALRQLCLKKKGKLTGFCLREYPSTPSWFQHFSSPSREQLAAFWRNPVFSALSFINYSPIPFLNNFILPSLIIIFPNGQGIPQSQLSFPLWSVLFDNSESAKLFPLVAPNFHPLHPIPIAFHLPHSRYAVIFVTYIMSVLGNQQTQGSWASSICHPSTNNLQGIPVPACLLAATIFTNERIPNIWLTVESALKSFSQGFLCI